MSEQIDFLRGQRLGLVKRLRFFRFLQVGSLVVLLAYCLIVGAIFSYRLYLDKQTRFLNQENSVKKQKIEELKDVESLQIVLKQRLTSLENFFSTPNRPDFARLLTYFEGISGGVVFQELTLSSEGEVNLSGEAPNAVVLGRFLDTLINEESRQLFSKITLSSLDRQKNGRFMFVIHLQPKG